MKKSLCFFLCLITVFTVCGVYAEAIEVSRCVTWILKPERSYPLKGIVNYYADYVKPGEIPPFPDFIPEYETEDDYCLFECWVRLSGAAIAAYYDEKTGMIPHGAPKMEQKDPEPIGNKDQVYGAFFRLHGKRFEINGDKIVNITDVTALLDYLSGKADGLQGVGLKAMIEREEPVTIEDVSDLLNYLS